MLNYSKKKKNPGHRSTIIVKTQLLNKNKNVYK